QDCACTDVGAALDDDGLNHEISLDDRDRAGPPGVLGAQDTGPRSTPDIVLENQITCIEVALRPHPDVGADATRSVEPTLDVGSRANEDTVAYLKGFDVFES